MSAIDRIFEDYSINEKIRNHRITMDEVRAYLADKRKSAAMVGNATMMCILSPALLVVLVLMSEAGIGHISEAMAAGAGLVFLFGMIAGAVFLYIVNGANEKNFRYMEKASFYAEDDIVVMVMERKEEYSPIYAGTLASGIVLCILAPLPLIVFALADMPDSVLGLMTAALFFFVSIGVNLIIRSTMIQGSFNTFLKEEECARPSREVNDTMEAVSGIYWCLIGTIYLAASFFTRNWGMTWAIWPIAGVFYGAVSSVCRLVRKGRSDYCVNRG